MKKFSWTSFLFYLMVISQLAVPVYIIIRQESTLVWGSRYKFRIQPFDPYDAFRGRYLAVQSPFFNTRFPKTEQFKVNQIVYGILQTDNNGFTSISNIQSTPPVDKPYLKVKISYFDYYHKDRAVLFLPFTRYYIEEKYASRVESMIWQSRRDDWQKKESGTYITVRIVNGYGVLEELYIFNQPVMEYIFQHCTNK